MPGPGGAGRRPVGRRETPPDRGEADGESVGGEGTGYAAGRGRRAHTVCTACGDRFPGPRPPPDRHHRRPLLG